jgi:hypothetical protein
MTIWEKLNFVVMYGFLFLSLIVLFPACPFSNTYYVDASYQGVEAGTASQPYHTITAALNRAVSGDTIEVAPGLYSENIRMKAGVKLVSKKIGGAIIHGGADLSGGWPTVTGADNAQLVGFTITGGYDGIKCEGTSPTIERNIIKSNYGDGGVICLNGSRAVIQNNTILGNLGNSSTHLSIGVYAEAATPTIKNNIITGNGIGYAPYQCSPNESYNNIWGNRRNYGYSATAGTGTISSDPKFAYTTNNIINQGNDGDYRLASNSPCRDAGDPNPIYNDSDGSRNDMGAFDGNGGYQVSLPAQEYFIESVLDATDIQTGIRINGTSRFTANPVFWFDATGRGTQGEQDARDLINVAVPTLTNHLYQATYLGSSQPPDNWCTVITVIFDTPQGVCFRQGVDDQCQDPNFAMARAGKSIIGGELHLSASWTAGFASNASAVNTAIHELGHVASLWHAFRGNRVMGYEGLGGNFSDYSAIEKEAFLLLYAYPSGTTLDTLIRDGKLTRRAMHPLPVIDKVRKKITTSGWPWVDTTSARAGDTILLVGSRLTLRWGSESYLSLRPPDYAPPKVYFGGTAVTADMNNQPNIIGGPARYLQIEVPTGLTPGWICLFVKVRGLESNPVYLEIVQ